MEERVNILCGRLKSEILGEMKQLSVFCDYIQEIKNSVQEKDWPRLEVQLKLMNTLAPEIEALEGIRNNTFSQIREELGLGKEATIHKILPMLGFSQRSEMEQLHRELRDRVLLAKIEYRNLGYYLNNISGFIYQLLEEIFPHTKGKIYSRKGVAAKSAPESIMINKQL